MAIEVRAPFGVGRKADPESGRQRIGVSQAAVSQALSLLGEGWEIDSGRPDCPPPSTYAKD